MNPEGGMPPRQYNDAPDFDRNDRNNDRMERREEPYRREMREGPPRHMNHPRDNFRDDRDGGRRPHPMGDRRGGPYRGNDEKQRIIREGLCFTCQAKGHISKNCPQNQQSGGGGRGGPSERYPPNYDN